MKKIIITLGILLTLSIFPSCSMNEDIEDLTVDLPESGSSDDEEVTRSSSKD